MTTEAELQRTETFDCSPSFSEQGGGIDLDEVSLTPNAQANWTHEESSVLESEVEEDTALAILNRDAFGSHCPGRQPGHMFHYLDRSSNAGGSTHPMEAPPRRPQTHINLMSEEDRLRTFSGWRYQGTVRKEDLARNGFVYTGTADKVRCVFCNTVLLRWAMGDIVEQEHRRHSPQCPFLRGDHVGNFPTMTSGGSASSCGGQAQGQGCTHGPSASHQALARGHGNAVTGAGSAAAGSYQASKHMCSSSPCNPSMAVEHDRLASFRLWPSHLSQEPEQMAHCGLYYTGDGDRVKCFHCNVLLYDWEPRDDPFREHARWFPGCEYLRLVKGDKYLEDVKSNRPTDEDQLESPAVQAVLFAGYSHDLIKKALEALREKSVSGDHVSAELLLKTVMDMEEPGPTAVAQGSSAEQTGDFQTLQRLHDSLLEKQQCKICMERDVEVIFFPCRHFVCCAACGSGVTTCPICRVHIQSRDKVFMA